MSSSLENRSSIRKLDFPICSLEVLRRLHLHFSANVPHSPTKGSVISPVSNSGSLMSPKGKIALKEKIYVIKKYFKPYFTHNLKQYFCLYF